MIPSILSSEQFIVLKLPNSTSLVICFIFAHGIVGLNSYVPFFILKVSILLAISLCNLSTISIGMELSVFCIVCNRAFTNLLMGVCGTSIISYVSGFQLIGLTFLQICFFVHFFWFLLGLMSMV